jgi:hypothetical protein
MGGVSLPVHHVFAGPTIAELAEVVSADPGFGLATGSSRHAELDALSDDDLDELLRAAIAQRNRRRAGAGGPDSQRGGGGTLVPGLAAPWDACSVS